MALLIGEGCVNKEGVNPLHNLAAARISDCAQNPTFYKRFMMQLCFSNPSSVLFVVDMKGCSCAG
jgi:hypothetical protein